MPEIPKYIPFQFPRSQTLPPVNNPNTNEEQEDSSRHGSPYNGVCLWNKITASVYYTGELYRNRDI